MHWSAPLLLCRPFSPENNNVIRESFPSFAWHIADVQNHHFTLWDARIQSLQRRYVIPRHPVNALRHMPVPLTVSPSRPPAPAANHPQEWLLIPRPWKWIAGIGLCGVSPKKVLYLPAVKPQVTAGPPPCD